MKRLAYATALLLAAAMTGGCTGGPRPPSAEPAPSPSPLPVPSPVVLPQAPEEQPSDVRPFRDVEITVPAWPAASKQCVSGRVHISSGGFYQPRDPAKTAVTVMAVVPVDFDGDKTDEYAVFLLCGEGAESGGQMIVGYRRDGRAFVPLGRIVGTQDGFQMMDHMRRKGNRIEILVSEEYTDGGQLDVDHQWRTYAWTGTRFRQVAGPTSFPENPPTVRLTVDVRQVVLRPVGQVRTGSLQLTIANVSTAATPAVRVTLELPHVLQPAGTSWDGCVITTPGTFSCPLPGIAAGGSMQASYELLAPREVMAEEAWVSAFSDSLDVFDETQDNRMPINFLYP